MPPSARPLHCCLPRALPIPQGCWASPSRQPPHESASPHSSALKALWEPEAWELCPGEEQGSPGDKPWLARCKLWSSRPCRGGAMDDSGRRARPPTHRPHLLADSPHCSSDVLHGSGQVWGPQCYGLQAAGHVGTHLLHPVLPAGPQSRQGLPEGEGAAQGLDSPFPALPPVLAFTDLLLMPHWASP